MPNVIVIAGPNGAGKSTLAPALLRDTLLAIERVNARVKLGGHSVPEEAIRRRFERGTKNFFELYRPISNSWRFFNAGTKPPTEIARYNENDGETIFQSDLWNEIKK